MRPITITGFRGASLALDELLLPESVGVSSLNQRPGFGDMRPWNLPGLTVASVPSAPQVKTMYRMGQDVPLESNYWLSWSTNVHVVRGFDTEDTTERTYFTGSGTPKWTDNVKALTGGAPYPQATRELGVPAPTGALTPTIAVDGTGTAVATSYLYTFVNDIGWESAPSPPSAILMLKPAGTVDLAGFSSAPGGNYGITKIRLYKLVTGDSGLSDYFFHREWAIGSTPTNPIDDARAVGADTLVTDDWRPCPGIPGGGSLNLTEATGVALTKLWNGMMSVITGKSIRISEPFKHYAWPLKYEIATTDVPVAQATFGQRLLVLTKGDPVLAWGSSPESMDSEPTHIKKPCSSAASVVEFNEGEAYKGVVWASEEELVWYGDGGYRSLTRDVLTADQWRAMAPSTMVASRYRGFYVCFYNDGTLKGFVIDPQNPQGIYYLSTGYNAAFRDPVSDRLYVLEGANIKRWDAGSAMTATFKSKVMSVPFPFNVGAMEVVAKGYPVTVKLWVNGTLRHTQTINSDVLIRPPSGFEGDEFQIEASSAARVVAVRLAHSVDDLMNT